MDGYKRSFIPFFLPTKTQRTFSLGCGRTPNRALQGTRQKRRAPELNVRSQMRALRTVSATCLLFGCAATAPDYKSPSSGPLARIRFATENPGVSVVYQYGDERCESNETEVARLRAGTVFKSNSKTLGIPLNTFHPNAAHEIVVQAGQPFIGVFVADQGPSVCKVPFSFRPSVGDYEVMSIVERTKCYVVISAIVGDSSGRPTRTTVSSSPVDTASCTRFRFRMS